MHRLRGSCGSGNVKVRDDVTLAVDEGSLARLVIDQEALERVTGFGSFGHRTPRCVKVDLAPHPINESLHGAQVFGDLSTRDVVGNRVHDASECRRARANSIGVRFVVEEPLHRALPDRIQRGSGQRNGRIGGPQRTRPFADVVYAPPVGRIRGGDQRRARSVTKGGDASQERCRVPSRIGRGVGIHQRAPTVDHQLAPTGDHVTAVRQGFDGDARRVTLVVVAWVAELRADHVGDEPARSIRSLVCRVNGEQGDLLAGTGHRHEKQVALLAHEVRGHLICRGEFLDPEQGSARLHVGPATFFESGDPHPLPLQPLGAVHGHDLDHRLSLHSGVRGLGDRLRRDGLIAQRVEEGSDRIDAAVALTQTLGRSEQRHDGVEIVMGARRAAQGCRAQALRPAVRARTTGPRDPQHFTNRCPAGHTLTHGSENVSHSIDARRDSGGGIDVGRRGITTEHKVRDEFSRRQHRLARVATLGTQRPAQSSKIRDIHTTDRAEQ